MKMKTIVESYQNFLRSTDTLRVYEDNKCVFKSDKDVLAPLVEYISRASHTKGNAIIFDKVTGNAAALLAIQAGAIRVYSPLGSELGARTLNRYHVEYLFEHVVPFILARNGKDMCPMEKLSIEKTPVEFYELVKQRMAVNN